MKNEAISGNLRQNLPGLAVRLRERRLELGLTQDQLAARAKVSREHISRIEAGHQRTPHTIHKLADALAVDAMWLTAGLDCYAIHIEGSAAHYLSGAGLAAAGNLPDDPPKMSGNLADWPADVRRRYAGVLKFLLGVVLGASLLAAWGAL